VVADADSIHITGGVSHALRLLASVLDAQTWATESPGSDGAVHVLRPTVRCRPVRMDEAGLDPSAVPKGVDAVLVTPTHQYPTGIAMPAERRRALIAGCSAARRWIVEDDYDSHLAVPGIAPAALQALAPESVILTGSVSKMLAPSLRLGWIVAPHRVAERLRTLRGQSDLGVSVPAQLTLAEFITSGDLDRHLRRVRAEYARRRQRLAALLAPRWQLTGAEVGVHAFVATKSPNELIDLLANSRIPAVAITGGRPGVVASVAACR
jgi:GntR family transcriptional regulator/MocR family aminotransferase